MQNTLAAHKLPPLILHPFADQSGPRQGSGKLASQPDAARLAAGRTTDLRRPGTNAPRRPLSGSPHALLRGKGYPALGRAMHGAHQPASRTARSFHPAAELRRLPGAESARRGRQQAKEVGRVEPQIDFFTRPRTECHPGDMPPQEVFSPEFLRNYHRYADQMFHCHLGQTPFADPEHLGFEFEIFASGEYSRMLEKSWAEQAEK